MLQVYCKKTALIAAFVSDGLKPFYKKLLLPHTLPRLRFFCVQEILFCGTTKGARARAACGSAARPADGTCALRRAPAHAVSFRKTLFSSLIRTPKPPDPRLSFLIRDY